MNYLTWAEILEKENIKRLFPMTHFRDKQYSIFLISDTSLYGDDVKPDEIHYEGSNTDQEINQKFYNLCNIAKEKDLPLPSIKIYHKRATNKWEEKGFYILADAMKKNNKYKFRLVRVGAGL